METEKNDSFTPDSHLPEFPGFSASIEDLYLQKTEATNWQYFLFMQREGLQMKKPGWGRQGDNPAVYVSWEDAIRYCNWRSAQEGLQPAYHIEEKNVYTDWLVTSYRLPTEAEWEYAARGGLYQQPFKYSGSDDLSEVGWYYDNAENRTQPVGLKLPNTIGLYDMSGNVWEWCWDWYGNYPSSDQSSPKGPHTGKYRVYRGGSWNNHEDPCRVVERNFSGPGDRSDNIGFRFAFVPQSVG